MRTITILRGGGFAAPNPPIIVARDVFGHFDFTEVQTTYTIATASAGKGVKAGELIVTNHA